MDIVVWGLDFIGVFYVVNVDVFLVEESYIYCFGCVGWMGV